ncbi:MAG: glycosyltransferase [Kiritimatiellae bacterium]|nr:glycosyltransferase [Kiritimatiellia bacterium]
MPPILSIIIPTRNEAENIGNCLAALARFERQAALEIIVVDNSSTDGTAELAREAGARVLEKGPERSPQKNFAVQQAAGLFVFIVDADMLVPPELLAEIVGRLEAPDAPDGLYIPERILAGGFWGRLRNFERSFYNQTAIDALRVIRKSVFVEAGGYDETLYSGEDWDLDRRIAASTTRFAITQQALQHNERNFRFGTHLKKRRRYGKNFELYRRKWHYDAITRRQFGPAYRLFGVFLENGKWKRSLRHPVLLLAVWVYKTIDALLYLYEARRVRRAARGS